MGLPRSTLDVSQDLETNFSINQQLWLEQQRFGTESLHPRSEGERSTLYATQYRAVRTRRIGSQAKYEPIVLLIVASTRSANPESYLEYPAIKSALRRF